VVGTNQPCTNSPNRGNHGTPPEMSTPGNTEGENKVSLSDGEAQTAASPQLGTPAMGTAFYGKVAGGCLPPCRPVFNKAAPNANGMRKAMNARLNVRSKTGRRYVFSEIWQEDVSV